VILSVGVLPINGQIQIQILQFIAGAVFINIPNTGSSRKGVDAYCN